MGNSIPPTVSSNGNGTGTGTGTGGNKTDDVDPKIPPPADEQQGSDDADDDCSIAFPDAVGAAPVPTISAAAAAAAETNLSSHDNDAAFVRDVTMNGELKKKRTLQQQLEENSRDEEDPDDDDDGKEVEDDGHIKKEEEEEENNERIEEDEDEEFHSRAAKRIKLAIDDDDDDDDDDSYSFVHRKVQKSSSTSSSFAIFTSAVGGGRTYTEYESAVHALTYLETFHEQCDNADTMTIVRKAVIVLEPEQTPQGKHHPKNYRSPRLLENLIPQRCKTISSFKVDIGNGSEYYLKKLALEEENGSNNVQLIKSDQVRLGLVALKHTSIIGDDGDGTSFGASVVVTRRRTRQRQRQQQRREHEQTKHRWFNDDAGLMLKSREVPEDFLSMCSRRLQADPAFVCFIVRRRVDHFGLDICEASKVLDHCHSQVFDDLKFYEYFNDEFHHELEAAYNVGYAKKTRYFVFLEHITSRVGPTLLNDGEFVFTFVKEWGAGEEGIYKRVSDRLRDDEEFILSSITKKSGQLRLKERRPRVTATLGALPYASERLKSDPRFMLRAETKFLQHEKDMVGPQLIRGDCVLREASTVLFDDERFMLEMHQKINSIEGRDDLTSTAVLRRSSERLRNDAGFVLQLCQPKSQPALRSISQRLMLDKGFVLGFLDKTSNHTILGSLCTRLADDEDIMRKGIQVWSDNLMDRLALGRATSPLHQSPLEFCGERVSANRDIVTSSIVIDPFSFGRASDDLQEDEVLALFALKAARDSVFIENRDVSKYSRQLYSILPYSLTSKAEFALKAVKVCPYLLQDLGHLESSGNYLHAAIAALGWNDGCNGERDFWVERYGRHGFSKLRFFWRSSFCFSDLQANIRELHNDLCKLAGTVNAALGPILHDRSVGWRSRYDGFSTGRLNINEWRFRQWEKMWLTDHICSAASRCTAGLDSAVSPEKFPTEVLRRIVEFTGTDQLLKQVNRIETLEPLINKVLERSLMVPTDGMGGIRVNGEGDGDDPSDSGVSYDFDYDSIHSDDNDDDEDDDDEDDDDEDDGDDDDDDDEIMSDESADSSESDDSFEEQYCVEVNGGSNIEFASDDNSDDDFELEEDSSDVDSDDVEEMEEAERDFDSDESSGDY